MSPAISWAGSRRCLWGNPHPDPPRKGEGILVASGRRQNSFQTRAGSATSAGLTLEPFDLPIRYSPALADAICARIARGESVHRIGKSQGMPSYATVFNWLARHKDFAEQYARAREVQIEMGIRPWGRPTNYSPGLVTKICERIMSGQTLRRICNSRGMPPLRTLFRWLDQHRDFAERYARAKEIQVEVLADEILDIADDPALQPGEKRVRIDARKWLAAKLKPRKYGDRASIEVEPIQEMSDAEIERRIQELLAKGAGGPIGGPQATVG